MSQKSSFAERLPSDDDDSLLDDTSRMSSFNGPKGTKSPSGKRLKISNSIGPNGTLEDSIAGTTPNINPAYVESNKRVSTASVNSVASDAAAVPATSSNQFAAAAKSNGEVIDTATEVGANLNAVKRNVQNQTIANITKRGGKVTNKNVNTGAAVTTIPQNDKDGFFWFYYIDAHEESNLRSGYSRVTLFGKVLVNSQYRNCSIVVHNMKRNIFLVLKDQNLNAEEHRREANLAFEEYRNCGLMKMMRANKGIHTLNFLSV